MTAGILPEIKMMSFLSLRLTKNKFKKPINSLISDTAGGLNTGSH